jgi:hypothetical protein
MADPHVVLAEDLLHINLAASGALAVLNPLLFQIDFSLFGSLGIGALQADLQVQLDAALQASFNLGIGISNPYIGFELALAGIAELQAQISLALSGALPSISIDASFQISALLNFSALLSLQIGGLEILLQAALAVKIPAMKFAADLTANLNVGPIFLLAFNTEQGAPQTLASVGASLNSQFSQGLTYNGNTINATDEVYGIVLMTASPSAWAGISATMAVA